MKRNSRFPGWLAAVLLAFLILASSSVTRAEDSMFAELRARRLVETQSKTIFMVMHPTAELSKIRYQGADRRGSYLVLTYAFEFEGLTGSKTSTMEFRYSTTGRFKSIRTKSTTSFIDPFTAANIAIGLLKDVIESEFEIEKNGAIKKAIDLADAKLALELYLAYKQASDKPSVSDSELVSLLKGSPSVSSKECQYWCGLLPRMTNSQREELKSILDREKSRLSRLRR